MITNAPTTVSFSAPSGGIANFQEFITRAYRNVAGTAPVNDNGSGLSGAANPKRIARVGQVRVLAGKGGTPVAPPREFMFEVWYNVDDNILIYDLQAGGVVITAPTLTTNLADVSNQTGPQPLSPPSAFGPANHPAALDLIDAQGGSVGNTGAGHNVIHVGTVVVDAFATGDANSQIGPNPPARFFDVWYCQTDHALLVDIST